MASRRPGVASTFLIAAPIAAAASHSSASSEMRSVKWLATHVHLDLAPDVRSPAFPFDAVYNETRAGARRLAALLAV